MNINIICLLSFLIFDSTIRSGEPSHSVDQSRVEINYGEKKFCITKEISFLSEIWKSLINIPIFDESRKTVENRRRIITLESLPEETHAQLPILIDLMKNHNISENYTKEQKNKFDTLVKENNIISLLFLSDMFLVYELQQKILEKSIELIHNNKIKIDSIPGHLLLLITNHHYLRYKTPYTKNKKILLLPRKSFTKLNQTHQINSSKKQEKLIITYLSMPYFNIMSINPDLRNDLTFIDLSGNSLKCLRHIKDMRHLRTLILRKNSFGEISPSSLYLPSSLEVLNLSHNKITDLNTEAFKNATNLQKLDLSNNLLQIMPCLPNHPRLKTLSLAHNKLKIAPEVQYPLQDLNLSNNRLEKLPDTFFDNAINLIRLNLHHNNLSEVKLSAHLTNLRRLSFSNNNFYYDKREWKKKLPNTQIN